MTIILATNHTAGVRLFFFKNMPIYIMVYYGQINEDTTDIQTTYKILQAMLLQIPLDKHFRGPNKYQSENWDYVNNFNGE